MRERSGPLLLADVSTAVVEVDLDELTGDIDGLASYAQALVLVRVNGTPIGYLGTTVQEGSITSQAIRAQADQFLAQELRQFRWRQRLLSGASGAFGPRPSLTVVVCTRNRPEDLDGCLQSLMTLSPAADAILVVDNAPSDDATEHLVRARYPQVHYVRETQPGLSRARNCAVHQCRTDLIAFVDDDVRVDTRWAGAVLDVFAEHADVMTVLGLVAPAALDAPAQRHFEWHGGFGRGFKRRWLRRHATQPVAPTLANTGTFGTGANLAFRRRVFDDVGGFNVALGAGTRTDGGEDLEMLFRILEAGHTVVYEPRALVWHRHRTTHAELQRQIASWGQGMGAHLASNWRRYPAERRGLITLAALLALIYYPRRVIQSFFDRTLRPSLTIAEWLGFLRSPWLLAAARRHAGCGDPNERMNTTAARPPAASGTADAALDLDRTPLPRIRNEGQADVLQVEVRKGGETLGRLSFLAGGHEISAARVADILTQVLHAPTD